MRLFLSYSSHDTRHRERLEKHLSSFQRSGFISIWHDGCTVPGEVITEAAEHHLRLADIILVLLSADFLATRWAEGSQADVALVRHKRGDAWLIPILVRPVHWETTPFSRFQALPSNGKPVSAWRDADAAWSNVSAGVLRAVKLLQTRCSQIQTKGAEYPELPNNENGDPIYLCSELLGFTLPWHLDLDAPTGYHLDRLLRSLALPHRIDHEGRFGLALQYQLAYEGRPLLRQHSLRNQNVLPGQAIELWIAAHQFAATVPFNSENGAVTYRGGIDYSSSVPLSESTKNHLRKLLGFPLPS